MELIVKLEDSHSGPVWLAEDDGEGDPTRTLVTQNAKRFPNRRSALKALIDARKYRPFRRAELVDANNPTVVFDT